MVSLANSTGEVVLLVVRLDSPDILDNFGLFPSRLHPFEATTCAVVLGFSFWQFQDGLREVAVVHAFVLLAESAP